MEDALQKWIRIPSQGKEPNTGLSRAFIYFLIKTGKVKTSCIRQPGKLTGVRLIWLPSLLEYIEKHVESTSKTHHAQEVGRDG